MKHERGFGILWMGKGQAIRLGDLMRMIPRDELVIIYPLFDGRTEYQREDALYDGTVEDWWKEPARCTDMPRMKVVWIRAWELEDTAGPVTMIVVEL